MSEKFEILFLCDSKDNLSPILQKLEKSNFKVNLEFYENEINLCSKIVRGRKDIILSDYKVWEIAGLQILKIIKQRDLVLPFIVIGEKVDEKAMSFLIENGLSDYIEKDNLNRLIPTLHRELKNANQIRKLKTFNFSQCLAEEKIQNLLNLSNLMIYVLDLNANLIDVNNFFEDYLEYNKEEIINSSKIYEFIHHNDYEILNNAIKNVIENTVFVDKIEYYFKKKNGTYIHISSNLAPIINKEGNITSILFVSEDLTKNEQFQQTIDEQIHRQALIAQFGLEAITETDMDRLFKKATSLLSEILDVEYTKVLELLPDKTFLRLRAGVGWHKGLVGKIEVENNKNSQAGFTLLKTTPVVVKNLKTETRFCAPKLLADHDVVSGMSVIIQGKNSPFGILGIHTKKLRDFSKTDINFLQSIANILAGFIVRDSTEKDLRESEEKYRTLTEQSLLGTVIIANRKIVFANHGISSILGFSIDKLLSLDISTIAQYIHPEDLIILDNNYKKIVKEEVSSFQLVIRIKNRDENYKYLHQYWKRIPFQESTALFINVIDITEEKKYESLLESSLTEKEILLKEIHHRVKNNLQIISSLIILQEQYLKDKKILEIFKDFQNRIKVMALIHQALYNSENLSQIHPLTYIQNLVDNLFKVFSVNSNKIILELEIENIDFNLENANACGLIINELVSNSLKHAFPEGKEGKIVITLKQIDGNKTFLEVFDNGIGFPKDLDYQKTDSLGLKLILTITKQIGGTISIERKNGTYVKITW